MPFQKGNKLASKQRGSKKPKTILKEKTLEEFRIRVFRMSNKLLNAQSVVALGTHKMIRMIKDPDGKMRVETVRDEKRMQELLDTGVYGKDYLIVAGSDPDWKAANALLDRAYGKATESVKHTGSINISDVLDEIENE